MNDMNDVVEEAEVEAPIDGPRIVAGQPLTLRDLLQFQKRCWLVKSGDLRKITSFGYAFFEDPLGWLSNHHSKSPSEAEEVFQMIMGKSDKSKYDAQKARQEWLERLGEGS